MFGRIACLLSMQHVDVGGAMRLDTDVFKVHRLTELDRVPAGALIVAVIERIGGDALVAVPRQQEQAAVVAILINKHTMCDILRSNNRNA
jgi:hypothetical protein